MTLSCSSSQDIFIMQASIAPIIVNITTCDALIACLGLSHTDSLSVCMIGILLDANACMT